MKMKPVRYNTTSVIQPSLLRIPLSSGRGTDDSSAFWFSCLSTWTITASLKLSRHTTNKRQNSYHGPSAIGSAMMSCVYKPIPATALQVEKNKSPVLFSVLSSQTHTHRPRKKLEKSIEKSRIEQSLIWQPNVQKSILRISYSGKAIITVTAGPDIAG